MKTILRTVLFALIAMFVASCTNNTQSPTATTLQLKAVTEAGVVKPNYKITLFVKAPEIWVAPPIVLEATTDANGIAFFDLTSIVTNTTAQPYYFGAFLSNSTTGVYMWKSVKHQNSYNLAAGSNAVGDILVKDTYNTAQQFTTQATIRYEDIAVDGYGWIVGIGNSGYKPKTTPNLDPLIQHNKTITYHYTNNVVPCGNAATPVDEIVIDTMY